MLQISFAHTFLWRVISNPISILLSVTSRNEPSVDWCVVANWEVTHFRVMSGLAMIQAERGKWSVDCHKRLFYAGKKETQKRAMETPQNSDNVRRFACLSRRVHREANVANSAGR